MFEFKSVIDIAHHVEFVVIIVIVGEIGFLLLNNILYE